MKLSPATVRAATVVLRVAAIVGFLIGLGALRLHLEHDPLADVRAYYDAGTRLNAGLPLYEQPAGTDDPGFYRYPPLLAIAFRPLALLPFAQAALAWEAILLVLTAAVLAGLRPRGAALLAAGMLAMPLLWTLSIGQAQALVTALMAHGSPFGVAVAGHIKLFPWAVAMFWLARRDVPSLARLVGWAAALTLLQLVLAPQDTIAYLAFTTLDQVGDVRNLSPYAVSPVLWILFVAGAAAVTWRLAPTPWGWPAAVALSVLITPRLLAYQLSTLLAGFGGRAADRRAARPAGAGLVPEPPTPRQVEP